MSAWEKQNQAIVWTDVDGTAYQLFAFNQSSNGVFINYPGHHLSVHASGHAHRRTNHGIRHEGFEQPYKMPPLRVLESRYIAGHWFSIDPDAVLEFGVPIPKPAFDSGIFLNPGDFPPFTQPVVEVSIYDPQRREDWQRWLERSLIERPTMEHLLWREYPLERYAKLLGVFLFRADHPELRELTDGVHVPSID